MESSPKRKGPQSLAIITKNSDDSVAVTASIENLIVPVSQTDDHSETISIEENNLNGNQQDYQPLSKAEKRAIARKKKREKRMRFQPKSIVSDRSNYFESFLEKQEGESINLKKTINATNLAIDHLGEIQSMLTALKQHSGNKTPLQLLPNYMRRRAASYNRKRLPCRLREMAKQQSQTSDLKKKVVSRKSRRRKINLQNEYAKRKGKHGWLETHLWHAKRFQMSNDDARYVEWDCRVALRPYRKCFRPMNRAVAKHCVVQDMSFFKCFELGGRVQNLIDILSCFIDSNTLQSVAKESREITVLLFDKESNPPRCIGPANILFLPIADDENLRHVWLWLHPTINQKVKKILELLKEKKEVFFKDISETVNRFSLIGPKSSVTLMSILQSYVAETTLTESDESLQVKLWASKNTKLIEKQNSTFVSAMKYCHNQHFHSDSPSIKSSHDGCIFPLLANDPRLKLPVRKVYPTIETVVDSKFVDETEVTDKDLYKSPLWSISCRKEISASRKPDHIVSTRKCEAKLLTGKDLKEHTDKMATPVPVVLVRRLGHNPKLQDKESSKNSENSSRSVHGGPPRGFGSGWDIIIPSNWGMAFWIPIIYHQALPMGLEMRYHSNLEYKSPTFPRDYPDTEAGLRWWTSELETNHKKFYKKPPSKRHNYSTLGIRCPFAPSWSDLFQINTTPVENFSCDLNKIKYNINNTTVVVGDNVIVSDELKQTGLYEAKIALKRTQCDDDSDDKPPPKKLKLDDVTLTFFPTVLRDEIKLKEINDYITNYNAENSNIFSTLIAEYNDILVCVKLSPLNKGVPASRSSLYLPTNDDIQKLQADSANLYTKGLQDCAGPVEEKHRDPYRKERREATKEAKRNKKRKPEKRVVIKRNYPFLFDVAPSRKVVGYVTSGSYLFSYAAGGGIGFVTLKSLKTLVSIREEHDWLKSCMRDVIKSKGLLLLMRNIDSDQYRFAILDMLML